MCNKLTSKYARTGETRQRETTNTLETCLSRRQFEALDIGIAGDEEWVWRRWIGGGAHDVLGVCMSACVWLMSYEGGGGLGGLLCSVFRYLKGSESVAAHRSL